MTPETAARGSGRQAFIKALEKHRKHFHSNYIVFDISRMNVSVPSVPLHLLQRCNMSGKILFNLALELYNCTIVLISLILCLELVEHSCQLLSHSSIINYLKPELKFPQPFKCSCTGIHVSLYREIKIRKCILGSNVSTVLSELWGHISSKLEKKKQRKKNFSLHNLEFANICKI